MRGAYDSSARVCVHKKVHLNAQFALSCTQAQKNFMAYYLWTKIAQFVTGCGLDDHSFILGRGREYFPSPPCPERLWGPPTLLLDGYWEGLYPQDRMVAMWNWPFSSNYCQGRSCSMFAFVAYCVGTQTVSPNTCIIFHFLNFFHCAFHMQYTMTVEHCSGRTSDCRTICILLLHLLINTVWNIQVSSWELCLSYRRCYKKNC
jgi:hypothetical protein